MRTVRILFVAFLAGGLAMMLVKGWYDQLPMGADHVPPAPSTAEPHGEPAAAEPVHEEHMDEAPTDQTPYRAFSSLHSHADTFFATSDQTAVDTFGRRVLRLLDLYKGATPRTAQIYAQVSTRLGFTDYRPDGTLGDLRQRGGGEFVVALFDEGEARHLREKAKAIFAYSRGSGMIIGPAMACPDKILAGVMYHELGHLLYDLEGLSGIRPPRQPVGSPEHFEEEVEMTELEGRVLDVSVDGSFIRILDRIIDRSGAMGAGGKYSYLHRAVTREDLAAYERMFDLESTGMVVGYMAITHFKLMLEFRYIDRDYRGAAGPMAQKVVRYRLAYPK